MLLSDRTFVDTSKVRDFQKAGIFYVLVVAGLHVGAIALVPFWAGRKLRISPLVTIVFTLALLLAYVALVKQPPRCCAGTSEIERFCFREMRRGRLSGKFLRSKDRRQCTSTC